MYRNLDPALLVQTVARLKERVQERFPGSGLGKVAEELHEVARQVIARTETINRPHVVLRAASTLSRSLRARAIALNSRDSWPTSSSPMIGTCTSREPRLVTHPLPGTHVMHTWSRKR